MANCPYIFKEDDKAVRDGRRQAGEVCGIPYATAKYGGFCQGHARAQGLIPKEKLDEQQANRTAGIRKRIEKISSGGNTDVLTESGESPYVNSNVLEAMNLNDPCDLKAEYAVFKALNINPGYEQYDEKMAYARWLRTPKHLRTPQTTEEAAEILGVTARCLYVWKTAPDVVRFINKDAENRALCMFPFTMYKLGCRIDQGDAQAIKLYKDWYAEKTASLEKSVKTLDLDPELEREALEYGEATGKVNRHVSLVSEKNMVIDGHFADDGMDEDREQ